MSASVKSYSTTMKILSFIFVITLIISLSAIPEVSARANQQSSMSAMTTISKKNPPFTVCIDDSDCQKLNQGDKFACFQV